jgi:hypothetical protein
MKYEYRFDNFDDDSVLITEINLFTNDRIEMSIFGKIDRNHCVKDFNFDNKYFLTSRMRIEYVAKIIHPEFFV